MTEDEHAKAKLLIEAIDNHRTWLGTTSRELRDEVRGTAKEIDGLSTGIENASLRHKAVMESMIEALNRNASSADKWASKMVALTVVLAIATAVAAFGAIYPIFAKK